MAIIKLAQYKNLELERPVVAPVTDEQVQAEIDNLLAQHEQFEVVTDRAVENGDTAVIDFKGFKDGVAFEGGKGEQYPLIIGSNSFIPGFEEQVIGLSVGEEKDINVSFPESYHVEDLKGAPVVFKIKLHEIKTKKENELNDEFAKSLGVPEITSVDTLRAFLKKGIGARNTQEAEGNFLEMVMQDIATKSEIEVSEEDVNAETDALLQQFEQQLGQQGANLDMYLEMIKKSKDEFKEEVAASAKINCKSREVISEIATLENIDATEAEVDAQIEAMASQYGIPAEQLKPILGDSANIKTQIKHQKVIEFLLANN